MRLLSHEDSVAWLEAAGYPASFAGYGREWTFPQVRPLPTEDGRLVSISRFFAPSSPGGMR